MFTYNQILHLLSKTAKNILADENQFAQISGNAADLISSFSGFTIPELAQLLWAKTAFVLLLEYFIYNRLDAPTSEFTQRAENYYANAMAILNKNKKTAIPLTQNGLGNINGLYNDEF